MSLYTCFQNQVIHAFRAHFFAKLKSEMAELSSGLGNSDEFIALSRGHGEARQSDCQLCLGYKVN